VDLRLQRYPSTSANRDRFILDRRGLRIAHDPWRYQDLIVEDETTADGEVARIATVFLTGRECPWRCAMCDLWRHTTVTDTPLGAIPAQLAAARQVLAQQAAAVTRMKIYNAGSFFDPRAVPERDYDPIAIQLSGLTHLVVESHPALIGPRVDSLLHALQRLNEPGSPPRLEVAMGLETAHPGALEQLHKQMTVASFKAAADRLLQREIALRAFLLVFPPFVPLKEHDAWLLESIDVAFGCGATAVSLIPTRTGNGTLESLATDGLFRAPRLSDIERSTELAYQRYSGRGRIFVDVWDLDRFANCAGCFEERYRRLHTINLEQRLLPEVRCSDCHGVMTP
jgi:radical SAM enzyme (TIGR01210 family)